MKKTIIILIFLVATLGFASCGNNEKIRKYENEVSLEEFTSSFYEPYNSSIVDDFKESDFTFVYNVNKPNTKWDLNERYDHDNQIYHKNNSSINNEKETKEIGYFYEMNGKVYCKETSSSESYEIMLYRDLSKIKNYVQTIINGFDNKFMTLIPSNKYYVDNNVYTIVQEGDSIGLPGYLHINQIIINVENVTYIEYEESLKGEDKITYESYAILTAENVNINIKKD